MGSFFGGVVLGATLGLGLGATLTYSYIQKNPELLKGLPLGELEGENQEEQATKPESKKVKKSRRRRRGRNRKNAASDFRDDIVLDEDFIEEAIVELSAMDRKLVSRGPTISLPKRSINFGKDGEARSLNQGEIQQVLNRERKRFFRCIVDARGNADLKADITVTFLVGGDGAVDKTRIRAPNYLFQQGLERCVRSAASDIRFESTGAASVVTLPFELS